MSREIKFRAFCPKYNQWVYGATFAPIDNSLFYTVDDEVYIDPETIGQYTGCKDKNGIEIYEGDIVEAKIGYCGSPKFHERTYILPVVYDSKYCMWKLYIANVDSVVLGCSDIYSVEVIGNIHDNPELIKQTEL